MSLPYAAQRPLASYGSRGSSAGKCTSWPPMAAISSCTTAAILSSTRLPSGSQVYPPGAARRT